MLKLAVVIWSTSDTKIWDIIQIYFPSEISITTSTEIQVKRSKMVSNLSGTHTTSQPIPMPSGPAPKKYFVEHSSWTVNWF